MPDIQLDFTVRGPVDQVFEAVATPGGLDRWWSLEAEGEVRTGATLDLGFGPGYAWKALVTAHEPGRRFELEMTEAAEDWVGTRVAFELRADDVGTLVRFSHTGWKAADDHFRTSTFCWALYLRLMRRWVEAGEVVAYADRYFA